MQALYGVEYVNTLIHEARVSGTVGAPTTNACVDAMVDALWNTCPKTRYLVHGGGRFFDISAVSIKYHNWFFLFQIKANVPTVLIIFLIKTILTVKKPRIFVWFIDCLRVFLNNSIEYIHIFLLTFKIYFLHVLK